MRSGAALRPDLGDRRRLAPGGRRELQPRPRREPALLEVRGTVTWREGDAVGIALDPAVVGHDASIHRALRSFLDARK